MEMNEKIKYLRTQKRLTLEQVGNYVGVGKATVLKWEKGVIQNMRRDKIAKLAAVLGTTPEYLMGWEENLDPVAVLHGFPVGKQGVRPIYGTISAGLGQYVSGEDFLGFETVDKQYDSEEYFYLRVKGDSMAPIINDNDLLLIKRQDSVDSGDIAALLVDGEEGFVKKVEYGRSHIHLISLNPYYPPIRFQGQDMERVRIVGKVVEMKRKF